MSDKKSEEFRQCLGIGCQKMVKKPEWFCPRCKEKKNKIKMGRICRARISRIGMSFAEREDIANLINAKQ